MERWNSDDLSLPTEPPGTRTVPVMVNSVIWFLNLIQDVPSLGSSQLDDTYLLLRHDKTYPELAVS